MHEIVTIGTAMAGGITACVVWPCAIPLRICRPRASRARNLRPGGPALGRVFVTSLRIWAQAGPDTAEGIARAVIDFAQQFLTEDHADVADTLRHLEAVGVGQALDAHPAPAGSHQVRLTIV
ncbi:hypothetical protein ACF1G5_42015 [Streptomyces coeruleorubidus]|uniref:hypothetical protein n=1 Tax=Streptomyces coeruleorubidus TaxID=116188 RepID=UPI0036FA6E47